MSLTLGGGPLSGRPAGAANYTIESPAHRLLFEPYPRRLRAVVGDGVVLDSTGGALLHETGILPVPYVPLADLDADALERSQTTTHCPFKGDASYWSLHAGGRVVPDAVWAYEEPIESAAWLRGYAALVWAKADTWLVEDEAVTGHLRDPYHRVDVLHSSRPVRVTAGGEVVAQTARPKLVYETSVPVRVYVPRADVRPGALVPSETRTTCPYKGEARYWHLHAGGARIEDAAWSYDAPLPEAMKAACDVCFDADGGVDVDVGEPL